MSDLRDDMPARDETKAHVALTLVLDVSGSMGVPIEEEAGVIPIDLLNNGINSMVYELKRDNKLRSILDLSVFTFGELQHINPHMGFRAVQDIEDQVCLEAKDGQTYIADVLKEAIEATRKRCEKYGACYKPWIVVITDGKFHDSDAALDEVGQLMIDREREDKQHFFGFGVGDYDRNQLEKFCEPKLASVRVVNIKAENFPKLFELIGVSLKTVSTKKVDEQVEIANFATILV